MSGGAITIVPKLPRADEEYTPEQRRNIDAQLDEAEKGPIRGPFNTAEEMIANMKSQVKIQVYCVFFGAGAACEAAAAPAGGLVSGSARNLRMICGVSGEVTKL